MNATEITNAITANNNGLIMPTGYELAIIKDGKIIAAGNDVADRAFNAAGDEFIGQFNQIVDMRIEQTPQHNHTRSGQTTKGATA